MSWFRYVLALTLIRLVRSSSNAGAQTPEITADSTPSSAVLQSWLRSNDPRLIAWAAYFANRDGDSVAIDLIGSLLGQSQFLAAAVPGIPEHSRDERQALTAVLDALIQQKAQLPERTITAIVDSSNLPLPQARSLFENWYLWRSDAPSGRLLPRIASLMLADSPPPEVAASIVAASEERLTITVYLRNDIGTGLGSGSTCGDSYATGVPEGWPVLFSYDLEENNPSSKGPVLVAVGDDRITYERTPSTSGFGSCFGVQPLNANTRHRLIAHWIGVPEDSMPWQVEASASFLWTDRNRYLLALGDAVETQRRLLRESVQTLVQRHILPADGGSIQPRLLVRVECKTAPCPIDGAATAASADH